MKQATLLVSILLLFIGSFAQRSSDNPYDKVEDYSEGLARVKLDGKYGYINLSKREVIEVKYTDAHDFSNGLAAVSENGKTWGYINSSGKKVIDFKLDDVKDFDTKYACAKKNGKWGIVDKYGNTVVPFKYDESFYLNDNGYGRIMENKKYGVVNDNGKVVVSPVYDDMGYFFALEDNTIQAKKDGKWGYINITKGKTVIPFEYDQASSFSEGLFPVKKNGKWGYVDADNKVVIPMMYYSAERFKGGEAKVAIRDGYYLDSDDYIFINKNNEKLGPGNWLFLYHKGSYNSTQFWSSNKSFPSDDIKKKWDEGFYITSLRYGFDDNFFLVMSKNTTFKGQRWATRETFDELNTELSKMWNGDKATHPKYRITYLSYINNKWLMIASEGTYTNNNQHLFRKKSSGGLYFGNYISFPITTIEEEWKKGRYVDAIALNPKDLEYVFTVSDASYYVDQKYESYSHLEDDELKAWAKKDYYPSQIVKHDGTYHVIYTKYTKGYKYSDQEVIVSETLPTRNVKGFWDKGYTITDIHSFERK